VGRARRGIAAEDALPPLREEEAIAGAILQRLIVQRDTLNDQEARALQLIETLNGRIEQLSRDLEREAGLNRDAGETIQRLEWEQGQIAKASEGHEARLEAAATEAAEAAQILQAREAALTELTEDVARLSARHQSAHRLLSDSRSTVEKNEAEATKARAQAADAEAALSRAQVDFGQAAIAQGAAQQASDAAEAALVAADEARTDAQAREAEARAARSEADGEAGALRAEVGALAKLVEREAQSGKQLLDRVKVRKGYEKALGAALADDLRAPELTADKGSGWAVLPGYREAQSLPDGVQALSDFVTVPEVLIRRIGQIGLVARGDGARLQAALKPGQRLVSLEGDVWRWDGFRAAAEDAPSAAALRLQQLNRLVELKRDLEEVAARAEGARQAHDLLTRRLAQASEADRQAREARREADRRMAEASRALSRAEADRSIAGGKLESARLAVARHEEEAMGARSRLKEAEAGVAACPTLPWRGPRSRM
jgi:chromosome segregation protein